MCRIKVKKSIQNAYKLRLVCEVFRLTIHSKRYILYNIIIKILFGIRIVKLKFIRNTNKIVN